MKKRRIIKEVLIQLGSLATGGAIVFITTRQFKLQLSARLFVSWLVFAGQIIFFNLRLFLSTRRMRDDRPVEAQANTTGVDTAENDQRKDY